VRTSLFAAAAVTCLSALSTNLWAQAGGTAAPANPGVVVVDIGKIFKENTGFTGKIDAWKKDVEGAEAALNVDRKAIQKQMEGLPTFNAGSPEYKKLEEEITRRQADFQVRAQIKQKEFLERESKIYAGFYQEINDEIAMFARQNGISLVLRTNNEKVDTSNREALMREINKPIVFQRNLDITDVISKRLNERAGGAREANSGSRPGVQRPTQR